MTRQQIVGLHVGQKVRVACAPGRYLAIVSVFLSKHGRVFQLDGGIWVGSDQIAEVLPA